MDKSLRMLTNMTFWQSPEWTNCVDSIYPKHGALIQNSMSPFREAAILFKRCKAYDIVHTMGVRESMLYGFLCALCGRDSRQVMTEIFLDEQRENAAWKFKTSIQRMIARRALGIITNSRAEIPILAERLKIKQDRFCFVPLNSTIEPVEKAVKGDGYILAAGRSLRDYPLLVDVADRINAPIIIIGGTHDLESIHLPDNVKLLREVTYAEYLDYVQRCDFMVLPLQQTIRPTGQVVMLEAMSFGKPVIATEHVGTIDYIEHGKNGYLVPPNNKECFMDTMDMLLNNRMLLSSIGDAALQTIREKHTNSIHTKLRLEAIKSFYGKGNIP